VPDAFFELASDRWEPPDAQEIAQRAIVCVQTAGADPR
jgi:hypothetical protein